LIFVVDVNLDCNQYPVVMCTKLDMVFTLIIQQCVNYTQV